VKEEKKLLALQLVRYGLPAVILIFYATASTEMKYTPESTYVFLQFANEFISGPGAGPDFLHPGTGTPSPMWIMLATTGKVFHVDGLLTVKIFSLFLASLGVLCVYLLAYEVVRDRLIALCISLSVAMQAWLLQAAPSGSALLAGLLLTLAGMFFLLRNDYLLASFLVGLSSLILWQAVGLLVLLCADVAANSTDKRRAVKVIMMTLLVYFCPLFPWLVIARLNAVSILPVLVPFDELSLGGILSSAAFLSLAVMLIAGILLMLRSRGGSMNWLRGHFAPMLWMLWLGFQAMAGRTDVGLMGVPFLIIYAFLGFMEIVRATGGPRLTYPAAFALAGVLLVQNQALMNLMTKPAMEFSNERARQLISIAYWLKAGSIRGMTIEAEEPGIISFYSDRMVRTMQKEISPGADLVVTSERIVAGYEIAFTPPEAGMGLPADPQYSVWRRK